MNLCLFLIKTAKCENQSMGIDLVSFIVHCNKFDKAFVKETGFTEF